MQTRANRFYEDGIRAFSLRSCEQTKKARMRAGS